MTMTLEPRDPDYVTHGAIVFDTNGQELVGVADDPLAWTGICPTCDVDADQPCLLASYPDDAYIHAARA